MHYSWFRSTSMQETIILSLHSCISISYGSTSSISFCSAIYSCLYSFLLVIAPLGIVIQLSITYVSCFAIHSCITGITLFMHLYCKIFYLTDDNTIHKHLYFGLGILQLIAPLYNSFNYSWQHI